MRTLAILCAMMLVAGCGKKFTCPNQPLTPVFIGYTDQEIDTIVLKRFEPGSNFSRLTDSFLLSPRHFSLYRQRDSATVYITDQQKQIDGEYEYQLIVPFDGKTVSVSEATYQTKKGKGSSLFGWGGDVCTSPVVSYKRNGVAVNGAMQEAEYLYIRK